MRVTKTSSILVDIVMVSNPELIKTSDVIDLTISDHFLAFAVLNLKQPKASPSYIITRSFKNYSLEKFANDISMISWDFLDLLPTVDEKLDAFNDLFLTCLDKHPPVKKIRIKHRACPFMTDDIKQLIINRNSLHRSARRFGSPNEWKAFSEKKHEFKLAIKSAEIAYYNKQVTENKNHSASIWKTIRQTLPWKAGHSVHYTKDTDVLAKEFNKFFISVGETAAHSAANLASAHGLATKEVTPRFFDTSEDLFMFQPVSSSEVKKVIMQMPSNKAPGFDKVSISVTKDCLPHILPSITSLINSSFMNNIFPKAWKRSEIVPLPKEGDFEQPCNNRPISLLPALSKVSETIKLLQLISLQPIWQNIVS